MENGKFCGRDEELWKRKGILYDDFDLDGCDMANFFSRYVGVDF